MKKSLFIFVLVAGMSLLTACGGGDGVSKLSSKVGQKQEEQQSDYVVALDDSFDTGIELDDTKKKLSVEEANFRSLKWGMTKDEVQYYEGTGFREPDENKMYYTRVREEEFPADAEYTFVDGKLAQGMFFITQNKADKPVTVKDFYELVGSFQKRFGEPKIADLVYVNEEDKTDDEKEQLELVKQGLLQFRTGWMLEDTELRVVLYSNNGQAQIGLQYKDPNVQVPVQ